MEPEKEEEGGLFLISGMLTDSLETDIVVRKVDFAQHGTFNGT